MLDLRSWFALKLGDVTVSGGLDPALDIGLDATLTINRLAYNSANSGTAVAGKRLNWATAFDFNGDGTKDILDPGLNLPAPASLRSTLPRPGTAGDRHADGRGHVDHDSLDHPGHARGP